jgi:ATP-dependent protease HslVU (ClpYQ) peptidase subunit
MTTVAADVETGVMVADSLCSDGDTKSRVTKIHRIGGELAGLAGEVAQIEEWLRWYRRGRKGRRPEVETVQALVLSPGGLRHYTGTGATQCEQGRYAIGTGGKAALAVMLAGHDCRTAVEIACQVDASSEGPLQVETLNPVVDLQGQ